MRRRLGRASLLQQVEHFRQRFVGYWEEIRTPKGHGVLVWRCVLCSTYAESVQKAGKIPEKVTVNRA